LDGRDPRVCTLHRRARAGVRTGRCDNHKRRQRQAGPDQDRDLRGEKIRPEKYAIHARGMVSMAGAEAERVLLNQSDNGSDRTDRANIDSLIRDDRLKGRLRKMTWQLVRRHYLAIEHVAETLVAANTLSGEHIEEWWNAVTRQTV
jgi:hypothetical protein